MIWNIKNIKDNYIRINNLSKSHLKIKYKTRFKLYIKIVIKLTSILLCESKSLTISAFPFLTA